MNTPVPQTKTWSNIRSFLIVVAIIVTLIALFYTEENWRGQRAWENTKSALESQGIDFKWADYIPALVPEDQNVFGVPEMQKWFTDRGATELSKKLTYPRMTMPFVQNNRLDGDKGARLVVAEMRMQLRDTKQGKDSNALKLDDPNFREQAAKMISEAIGPVAMHPGSLNFLFTARSLEDIRPAQIALACNTLPTTNDLLKLLPAVSDFTETTSDERLHLEAMEGGYTATMWAPDSTRDFLKWNEQFKSDFELIRKALKRPLVRMEGNYNTPTTVEIPNFVTVRVFAQTLAAMTECHLLQGNPETALDDLTRMHEICHIFTNRPITLVGSMINVAVRGLYVDTIADGLRWQAWREPQLTALEEQLKAVNLIGPLRESFQLEVVAGCENLRTAPSEGLTALVFGDPGRGHKWNEFEQRLESFLFPHGWIYQNMVTTAQRAPQAKTWFGPANQTVFPKQVDADQAVFSSLSSSSPFSCIAVRFMPNYARACQTAALNMTKVNQAIIACALERFHLAHGEYPENLNALVPQYLNEIPNDVIGSQPPPYRRGVDGNFVLYSIGWNGIGGGGRAGKLTSEGEWVWPEASLK